MLTGWGSWLPAVEYYSKHFDSVQKVVNLFNAKETASIKTAQEIFTINSVRLTLLFNKKFSSKKFYIWKLKD